MADMTKANIPRERIAAIALVMAVAVVACRTTPAPEMSIEERRAFIARETMPLPVERGHTPEVEIEFRVAAAAGTLPPLAIFHRGALECGGNLWRYPLVSASGTIAIPDHGIDMGPLRDDAQLRTDSSARLYVALPCDPSRGKRPPMDRFDDSTDQVGDHMFPLHHGTYRLQIDMTAGKCDVQLIRHGSVTSPEADIEVPQLPWQGPRYCEF
jgi:hypothetical protein